MAQSRITSQKSLLARRRGQPAGELKKEQHVKFQYNFKCHDKLVIFELIIIFANLMRCACRRRRGRNEWNCKLIRYCQLLFINPAVSGLAIKMMRIDLLQL